MRNLVLVLGICVSLGCGAEPLPASTADVAATASPDTQTSTGTAGLTECAP